MDSKQSNFADELRTIDDEVRVDVDKILRLATAFRSHSEVSDEMRTPPKSSSFKKSPTAGVSVE